MDKNIFREYDIRGVYPVDINEEVAYKIGLGYGSYIQEHINEVACVISHDNRLSGPALKEYLIKGLLESGIKVFDYGLTTTPMHYYARYKEGVCGIMITASHNPKDDNGFKFSVDRYANARGSMIQEFRAYIEEGKFLKGSGILETKNIEEDYINYIINNLKLGQRKLKVVLDPANGVATIIARKIYEKLNIELVMINEESDGTFPSHHPDPTVEDNLEQLKAKVLEVNADLGIGFDGDGDRIGIVDNLGNMVPIEAYAIIILRNMFDTVEKKVFLYDAKCSDNFKDEVTKLGGEAIMCRTGSSFTQAMIIKENFPFGFQQVGHVSFNDRLFDIESAMYASLRLIEILSNIEEHLSDIVANIPKYFNTPEIKIASSDDIKLKIIDKVKDYCEQKQYKYIEIDGLKILFNDGWAYIRASNTGPNITMRFEAKTNERLQTIQDEFNILMNKLKSTF